MRLTGLSLRHFRNLAAQELDLPPEGFALVGENAQGKTNLLEAIYYLEVFRSFRGAPDDQLVAFGEGLFRVSGRLAETGAGAGGCELSAAYQRQGRQKRVKVDGSQPERLGDAVGRVGAVLFSPADVTLVSGPPGERRRFLDVVLSLNERGYLAQLQRFRQSLAQRNTLLREDEPASVVRAWDEPLVTSGAQVMAARQRWTREREAAFRCYHAEATGGQEAAMEYEPSLPLEGACSLEEIEQAFRDALQASSGRERRMGTTVTGPHRDELGLRLPDENGGLDVRRYGSGGQRRTVALALRLVEADTLRSVRGGQPLILLDDVFAELDSGRSERVLGLLERSNPAQVVLTAPKESDVRLRRESLPRWRIEAGRIWS